MSILKLYWKYHRKAYPLGSVSVFTELPEKIPSVNLEVSFQTLGGMTERGRIPLGSGFGEWLRISLKPRKLSVKVLGTRSGNFKTVLGLTLSIKIHVLFLLM